MSNRGLIAAAAAALLAAGPALALDPATIDWSGVPTNEVKLFFPGQSTYQWLRSSEHKRAQKETLKGEACFSCHEGEEEEIGELIAAGDRLEPNPIDGKGGVIDLAVQAAHDSDNLYFRFQWQTSNPYPGSAHPHWRFDGEAWKAIGWPRLHSKVWDEDQPAIYEDRLSMMIDDGSVPMFAEQGCWLSCHDGMRDNPDLAATDDVKAHSLLGGVLKKKDVRKYLPASRSDEDATWDLTRSVEEIAAVKAAGGFLDLMQWRAHRSNPIGMADDGYVLEYRLTDAGKSIFTKNWDGDAKQPKYMFDAAKVGFSSRVMDEIRDLSQPSSLIVGHNTVAFDPDADWKEGDMIPEYALTPDTATGSAADNSDVTGTWEDGVWTVLWTRKLDTGHPLDDKIMSVGETYTFGFAVHDDNITTRGHHVSWPLTIGVGVEADITAVSLQ
jgi:hypothetical protein